LINGHSQILIDKGQGLVLTKLKFKNEDQLRRIVQQIALSRGKRLDQSQPYVDLSLSKNIRFHCVLSPIASPGTLVSMRIHKTKSFSLVQLQELEMFDIKIKNFLINMLQNNKSFVISGGTGSGKTTLLNSLISEIDSSKRILVIEDSKEILSTHPQLISLEARQANIEGIGKITLRDLVKQALRMRADRLIIGEVRGEEVIDWLAALNTGHNGGAGTIHANSISEVITRFETLGLMAGVSQELIMNQLKNSLDYVIHLEKDERNLRKVKDIGQFVFENNQLVVQRVEL
jgi:pilus assembly protein CpaF